MTDLTVFNPMQVPAFARGRELSDATKALLGNPSIKRISIKGGVFRLIVGGREVSQIEDRHLDVIIAAAAPFVSRVFYGEKWDPDSVKPPKCWSNDGAKPDMQVKEKQAPTCAECPNNIKGSGEGDSRACRFQQRLAVMLPDDMSSGVYQLTVPAASIFPKAEGDKRPLKEYVNYLAAQTEPINVDVLVTRMKFDTKAESPKLFFSPVRFLTDGEFAAAQAAGKSEDANRAIALTVSQADNVPGADTGVPPAAAESTPPPAETPVAAKAPKKPKKVEEPVAASAEADEPEKRAAPRDPVSAVPASSDKVANLVAEWDDE